MHAHGSRLEAAFVDAHIPDTSVFFSSLVAAADGYLCDLRAIANAYDW